VTNGSQARFRQLLVVFHLSDSLSEVSIKTTRIRNAKLDRFTPDRMIAILGKLDENVEVRITFHPRRYETHDRPDIR
jgi:hypothetical protein